MLGPSNTGRAAFVCDTLFPVPVMLRIALPSKGRLNLDCRELLADAGLEVRASSDRSLTASLGGEFEAIFVRAGARHSTRSTPRSAVHWNVRPRIFARCMRRSSPWPVKSLPRTACALGGVPIRLVALGCTRRVGGPHIRAAC